MSLRMRSIQIGYSIELVQYSHLPTSMASLILSSSGFSTYSNMRMYSHIEEHDMY